MLYFEILPLYPDLPLYPLPLQRDFTVFNKIEKILLGTIDHINSEKLDQIPALLKSISSESKFQDAICFRMFLRFLDMLENSEDGITVIAMSALVSIRPSVAHYEDSTNMYLLHYLANSSHFSFFLTRAFEPEFESYHQNPFEQLLNEVLVVNRSAAYRKNLDGECPVHIHIRNALTGSNFLSILLQYSPSCAAIESTISKQRLPIQMLLSNHTNLSLPIDSVIIDTARLLSAAYPAACFLLVTDTIVRLELNSSSPRSPPTTTTWSAYSFVKDCPQLKAFMMNSLVSEALGRANGSCDKATAALARD